MGGRGGDGLAAFDRGPNRRIGPPSGGHAGRGGHVRLTAHAEVRDLAGVGRRLAGGPGGTGAQNGRTGAAGTDKEIRVPVGTLVWHEEVLMADLAQAGDSVVVARGGRGGQGNVGAATGGQRDGPEATAGEEGEVRELVLELRLLADVGLAGLPNAGKSSLLYGATRAAPRVADYAFSTLRPSKGVVRFSDHSSISLVDLPGLIKGASEGRGLGHSFLRHLQRTPILCLVLDAAEKPVAALRASQDELKAYDKTLLDARSLVVVANKMDLEGAEAGLKQIEEELKGSNVPVFPVSARIRSGFAPLMLHLRERVLASTKH